jgi:O-succinylbenzoic acid--CoA ligase
MSYSHSSIRINQREVILRDIVGNLAPAHSEFESEIFFFIRNWLEGIESFKLFTSGSTGSPKEIILTRHQLQQSASRTREALGLTPQDTALVCLDTKYIAGKMMLVRALEGNMKIIAIEPSSNPLEKIGPETGLSFGAFVPLQLHEMLNHTDSARMLNQFKVIIVGGASIDAQLESEIKKLSCAAYATYGMTETVSHIALQKLNGTNADDHFITLPGTKISTDERGCLVIDLPEFSEKIVTNDNVEIISPTAFRWLGRYDNVINSGGFKITPERIEKLLASIFKDLTVKRSYFIGSIPDVPLGQKLFLAIEGFPISAEKKVLLAMKQHLHPYEVPKKVFYIREFIRTETGKINRTKTTELITQ